MKQMILLAVTLFFTFAAMPAAAGEEPIDTVLAHLDEQISECLDDPVRLEEGHALIRQALSMEGVEKTQYYPVIRFHEGTYYMGIGDIAHWKQNRLQLLQELPLDDWQDMSISVPQELGLICRREGKIDSALFYYDQALQEARQQGDLEWLAAISANVGILHYNLSHFHEAEQYLEQGLTYVRRVDDPYTELCLLQTCGAVKVMLDKLKEAEPLLQEAYQMATEAESPDWQLRCLTTMMPMYDKLGMPDSSRACLQRGDALLPLLPPQGITSKGFVNARANHYYEQGQWELAVADYETSMANDAGGLKTAAIFERMANSYARLGRWQEAFCYMDSARIEADTLASERLTAQMAEFNAKYQTMEKDLRIARLESQRLWIAIVAVVILFLLAGLGIFLRLRHQRHEAQMRIATLEDERRRIARELHDGLCNDMLALEMRMQGDAACYSEQLNRLRQQARQLSHQLMPPEFTHLSIHQLLGHLMKVIDENTTLTVTYEAQPSDDELWRQLPASVSHELYRIVQETTTNIVKGGTATTLNVSLLQTAVDRYLLSIVDDGQATPADTRQTAASGLGHRTQQDRIKSIGAHGSFSQHDGKNVFELTFTA